MTKDTRTVHYVGFGGKRTSVVAELELGWGSTRGAPPRGIRRAIWDAAYGYVNGFKLSAIAYYVTTRSLSATVWHFTYFRENPQATNGCGGMLDTRTGRVVWCKRCHPDRAAK